MGCCTAISRSTIQRLIFNLRALCRRNWKFDNATIMAVTVAVTVNIKLFYSDAGADELRWVLFPTVVLVELFSSISFVFDPLKGYVAIGVPVVIGPGCAGLNFFVIALCMSVFSFIGRFPRHKLYWFVGFSIITFLLTVFVNGFRILGGLILLRVGEHISIVSTPQVHSAQGTLFYFLFLVLYFTVVRALLDKKGGQ